jgi:hypothetical protein
LEHTRAVLKDCLATVQELAVYDADFYERLPARVADIRDAIGDKPVVSLREENERFRKALEAIAAAKWAVWASGVASKALGKEGA